MTEFGCDEAAKITDPCRETIEVSKTRERSASKATRYQHSKMILSRMEMLCLFILAESLAGTEANRAYAR